MLFENFIKRFHLSYVISDSGCWLWSKCDSFGYGKMAHDGETLAHRISYKLFKGTITSEEYVKHSCENINCVNPDHLFKTYSAKFEKRRDKKRIFEKFNERYTCDELTDCWNWDRNINQDGYGIFVSVAFPNETLAHRISFILHTIVPLLGDICVLHKCDNRKCVNPDHLFLGNKDINNKDRASKGRSKSFNSDKTHCKRGHLFDQDNTYFRRNGGRMCRKCACLYQKNRKK